MTRQALLLTIATFAAACAAPEPLPNVDEGGAAAVTTDSTGDAAKAPRGDRRLGTTAAKLTLVDSFGCGNIDNAGVCDGDEVLFCDAGELWAINCANHGLTCGYSAAYDWYDCVEPVVVVETVIETPVDSCGGLDYAGTCYGPEAHWCEGGMPASVNCADYGMGCDYLPELGYFGCTNLAPVPPPAPPVVVDPCQGISFEGTCEGTDVLWCDGESLQSMVCAYGCGWNDAGGYFDCLPEPVVIIDDPCEGVSFEGECIGDTVYWCDGNGLQSIECLYGCGFSSAGYYDCL
jgi:hypothetical protein